MKRQTIYAMLIVAFSMAAIAETQAQTAESGVSEARIRRLLSGADGTKKAALQFSPERVGRVQLRMAGFKPEASPSSSQELRALIFENYTPQGAKVAVARGAAVPRLSRTGGGEKLPSESAAAENIAVKQSEIQAKTPPTQGNTKEE